MELAKAKNLKQWSAVARISDVLRCLRLLNIEDCHKICNLLKDDYNQRLVYTRYLLDSKQMLLASKSYLEGYVNFIILTPDKDKLLEALYRVFLSDSVAFFLVIYYCIA